jgi:hypothetical protein
MKKWKLLFVNGIDCSSPYLRGSNIKLVPGYERYVRDMADGREKYGASVDWMGEM